MVRLLKGLFISLLVGLLVLINIPLKANLYINSLAGDINKRAILWYKARSMDSVSGENFVVFHDGTETGLRDARIVLDAAEGFYPALASAFGVDIGGRTPVILYGDVGDLNRSFGWPANAGTMGVYWAGTIRVLAPGAWIAAEEEKEVRARYIETGPMAHEITHLFVDRIARGNCPRWFNEGVAQYWEYRLTGFNFGAAGSFPAGPAYTLCELDNFDALDQNRAYRQSYSMVTYFAETGGRPAVLEVLSGLGAGKHLDEVMTDVTGSGVGEFYRNWRLWIGSQ